MYIELLLSLDYLISDSLIICKFGFRDKLALASFVVVSVKTFLMRWFDTTKLRNCYGKWHNAQSSLH